GSEGLIMRVPPLSQFRMLAHHLLHSAESWIAVECIREIGENTAEMIGHQEVDPGERGPDQVTERAMILNRLFKQRKVLGHAILRSLFLFLRNLARPQTVGGEQERLDLIEVVHPLIGNCVNQSLLE
ncbi:hypothetical protein PENTCL1PPCAC_15208, partial [Pristionchus entomophagus]